MRRFIAGVLLSALTLLGVAVPATAQEAYPVPYNFLAGISLELSNPGGSAPGSNDWSCKPSDERPNPVVLVHGTFGNRQDNWGSFAPLLANEGYCVFALTYGALEDQPWPISAIGGLKPIEESAEQLREFVDRVLQETGAEKVDLIGHSQGTLMPTYYVQQLGGADKIDKYVSLAPLWDGTDGSGGDSSMDTLMDAMSALIDDGSGEFCLACPQMATGSEFLQALQANGIYAPEVTYTNILTRYDQVIVPYTSGYLEGPNATNIVLQDDCSTNFGEHLAVAADSVAAAHVLNALDPDNQRSVPCQFVVPIVGG
ncbi:esterase/lipase family protein [Rhodococcus spongiicola]|uniref:Alpha/beta fold hydrolase n=1 Tax=Rhodococcus spongiicola TaxID=2487352 RepID=A0A3S3AC50_9NOCA|nr:alpha/beta fold hydrolase [Rhodococcus spongiicola]